MAPGPVARTVKPCGCASTGRVRLKAHPVPQPKPRDPSRGPQAADPSSTCRQERAGRSRAQRSCAVPLLTFIPFRGGEVDSETSAGWPEWVRARRKPRPRTGPSSGALRHLHSLHPWRAPCGRLCRASRLSWRFVFRGEKRKSRATKVATIRSSKQLAQLVDGDDERINLRLGVGERQRRAQRCGNAEELHEGMCAVVA